MVNSEKRKYQKSENMINQEEKRWQQEQVSEIVVILVLV
jgi:hypothetical protein